MPKNLFKKGYIPWNKEKHLSEEHKRKVSESLKGNKHSLGYKHSEEAKKKMSKAQKGHIVLEETRRKISMATKGRIFSKEHRIKLSKAQKGKKLSEQTKEKISKIHKGRKYMLGYKHSEEARRNMSESHKGSKSHLWKGGITSQSQLRTSRMDWFYVRTKIYKRDNYTCQICGIQYKDKNGNGMNVHHIIPYRITQDNSENNLITLCDSCHIKEERKYYNEKKDDSS